MLFFLFSLTIAIASSADEVQPAGSPKLIYADGRILAEARANYMAGNQSFTPAVKHLLAEAQKALRSKPTSVMDKGRVPPSGDKHDFVSQAPYFWRDAGGHYVRRDGERNPESGRDSDAGRVGQVCSNVHTLAYAFYFTGNQAFAKHAAELLRVFFLNPATRMNPNLNYGQGIPGEVEGRPMGIIGTRGFVELVDALCLLKTSNSWTEADQQGMVAWMTQYLNWLQTSKIGIGERDATNNHGTFYDTQAAALAVFVGKPDLARQILDEAREKRIAKQIEPEGKMPRELQRTKSFGYSAFNLRALEDLASIGENLGIDLWHFQTSDGRSIRKALDFIGPYANPARKWPYQQITKPDRSGLVLLLLRAAPKFPDAHYERMSGQLSGDDLAAAEQRLEFKLGAVPSASTAGKENGSANSGPTEDE